MGLQSQYELEFYGNVNIDLDSFTDLVRIHSLAHSFDAWEDNQDRWVYEDGLPLSALITCQEDVFEYCQSNLGFSCREAFIVAEAIQKGRGFPYELRENAETKSWDWSYKNMPVRFESFCEKVSYLWTRVYSYCLMALAWRCAWYRLHECLEDVNRVGIMAHDDAGIHGYSIARRQHPWGGSSSVPPRDAKS